MNKQTPTDILSEFSKKKILVIGDIMLDAYIWGNVSRISPEAPVPVVLVSQKEYRLGGAGNVALNIKSLGAAPLLVSMTGDEEEASFLFNLLNEKKIAPEFLLKSSMRKTTTKTRIIANHQQQLIRIDNEDSRPLNEFDQNLLTDKVMEILPLADAVVFSDYDKGVLNQKIIQLVISEARRLHIPTIADPKKDNFFSYQQATLFKPNLKELQEGLQMTFRRPVVMEELNAAANKLFEKMNIDIAFITLSDEGIYVNNRESGKIIPSHKRNIYDVSGAGDTVSAVAALSMACGLDLFQMAELTNLAGGIVCEKVGVVPVEPEELRNEMKKLKD